MTEPAPYLVIRADAGPVTGAGHWMRCLALAQGWCARGGRAVFLDTEGAARLESHLDGPVMTSARIRAEAGSQADAFETAAAAKKTGAAWIVTDGYCFGASYQAVLKQLSGARFLAVDDQADVERYVADVILNQNLHAHPDLYEGRAGHCTALLLGPKYALLRQDFLRARGLDRVRDAAVRRILITFGGGDCFELMSTAVKALAGLDLPGIEAAAVYNGPPASRKKLSALAEKTGKTVRIFSNTSQMADLMLWADLALSAAGSSCWELACLGVPAAVIVLADNQRLVAERLSEKGVVCNLGWHAEVSGERMAEAISGLAGDAARRRAMSEAGKALVDGGGASRVLDVMKGGT